MVKSMKKVLILGNKYYELANREGNRSLETWFLISTAGLPVVWLGESLSLAHRLRDCEN